MSLERRYVIQGRKNVEEERLSHAISNMRFNKAYRYAVEAAGGDPRGEILEDFIQRFRRYREGWRGNPRYAIERRLHHGSFEALGFPPLCVDIETAAVCDLACPFCFRQWIATPDTLIQPELYRRVVDQCAQLGVASIKLNWRGEPLLHPKLPELIDYAKQAGILETMVNTNAVTLTEAKSRALIEAGLDLMIYSFDGGTKETYQRMRVGRFQENRFETVYGNIQRFAQIRKAMGSPFPRTQIQMILMEDTFQEQEAFFSLFLDCVDDVTVKAYTERGGSLPDLDPRSQELLHDFIRQRGLPDSAPYWRDREGGLWVSVGRLPCEQPYQRMMVTTDGQVSMCCYDWGMEYPIGVLDAQAFQDGDQELESVFQKSRSGAKGFERLSHVKMPRRFVDPPQKVETLREIWYGDRVNQVRQRHVEGRLEEIPVCRSCPFKETYRWVKAEGKGEPTSG